MTTALQPALIAPGRRVTPTAYRVLPAAADERDWLTARRRGIGSSDVAAVLGVADRRTALHVWYDKRGALPDDDAGEAALWGRLHEETVAREWARRNRTTVRRVGLIAHVDHQWRMCTLDRQVGICPLRRDADTAGLTATCALEVKTRNAWVAGKWRRSVPDDVLAQVVWQMTVTGYDHIHIACLIGGNDYRQYVIRRDAELEADIVAGAGAFWRTNVVGGARPVVDQVEEYAEWLIDLDNRVHPDREGAVRLDYQVPSWQLVEEYEEARLAVKAGKRRVEAAKLGLIEALDGHEVALVDEGRQEPLWTYLPRRTAPKVDLAVMAEKYPDAYAECVRESSTRVISIARDLRQTEETS